MSHSVRHRTQAEFLRDSVVGCCEDWDAPDWEAAEEAIKSVARGWFRIPEDRTDWVRAVGYTLQDGSVVVFEQMGVQVGLGYRDCYCINTHDARCEASHPEEE